MILKAAMLMNYTILQSHQRIHPLLLKIQKEKSKFLLTTVHKVNVAQLVHRTHQIIKK